MNMMIDESRRIDIVKSAFDQIGRALTNPARKLLRRLLESPADEVNETH
ncbi:MAG TPA: hypothetical protein VJP89_24140 [Pyrinomonadaceae bacterium]|nr:hypothetical protein [Pyrinomonadaceae bacterium]